MIADMHCHYPMHVLAQDPPERWAAAGPIDPSITFDAMADAPRRPGWLNKLRASLLRRLGDELNYRDGRWRVSLDELERGDVRAVFSVLYDPFAEIDLDELPGSDPEQGYFGDLIVQLQRAENDLRGIDPEGRRHAIVGNATELDRTIEEGKVAFMHCVEGGFHIGGDLSRIDERVADLAARGVVYITVSHLFWRGVAGNAPALPFLSDRAYNRIFFLWRRRGLSKLGRELIEAMYRHRILIDVSHMNQPALDQTFALLDELDRKHKREPEEFPVIASHAGYRFGRQSYMLSPETIRKLAKRDGVIGLILAQHQLNDGLGVGDPEDPEETMPAIFAHIDAIRESAKAETNLHVGIGSDLDGFIKPTVAGIETAADLARLKGPLERAYGESEAAAILGGNAVRVARRILAR
jgi:microsomal dipeptidase-like Zn-dependent dipeptidase